MNDLLKEKLSGSALDFSTYGDLPLHEDIVLIAHTNNSPELIKHWEKLNYLRKNLKILDRYIATNKGETIKDWLAIDKSGMSPAVMDKIGSHNNNTGGISAYFFDLQNFFDEEETQYDVLEEKMKIDKNETPGVDRLRNIRGEKRKNRRVTRKKQLKDLKTDDKGYLVLEVEPEPMLNADGPAEKAPTDKDPVKDENKATPEQVEKLNSIGKKRGKVAVWIAGTTLLVAAVYSIAKSGSSENK